jgi:hypothetical protein
VQRSSPQVALVSHLACISARGRGGLQWQRGGWTGACLHAWSTPMLSGYSRGVSYSVDSSHLYAESSSCNRRPISYGHEARADSCAHQNGQSVQSRSHTISSGKRRARLSAASACAQRTQARSQRPRPSAPWLAPAPASARAAGGHRCHRQAGSGCESADRVIAGSPAAGSCRCLMRTGAFAALCHRSARAC